ncbi:MAG TPA: hypothetical protein VFQ88_07695 [Nevskiaceae bacterium]|nr:hypothetical protein [Nevskiaceae bacterium]
MWPDVAAAQMELFPSEAARQGMTHDVGTLPVQEALRGVDTSVHLAEAPVAENK